MDVIQFESLHKTFAVNTNHKSFWPDDYKSPGWLPDWREEDEYSHIARITTKRVSPETQTLVKTTVKTKKSEYAWEFLRRNPCYQADYLKISDLCEKEGVTEHYKKYLGYNFFLVNSSPPPSMLFHAELYRTLRKWGLGYYLLDPATAVHDTAAFEAVRRLGVVNYHAMDVQLVPLENEPSKQEPIPVDGGIFPEDTEIFWLFDSSLPIEPQLQNAREFLERVQYQRYGKKIQASKTDPSKFILYLRILDADARQADDKDILRILFPGEDRFSYMDKSDKPYKNETSHRNPGRDMLRNHRKAAYELREDGYRRLFA